MFRRLITPVTRNVTKRSYFYANPGETGISAATLKLCFFITVAFMFVEVVGMRIYVFNQLSTKRQFVEDSTDLWEDDGTQMSKEDADAQLRIQRERIMPFLK
ncbi:hypothetical protein STCU_01508 [Strigomonas culicis]|uniref:Uncharacterized protein n=1 Tax=Strigomonas culicis TaxID=28005 RepID=S9V0S7_9TRYP|nr:hypothetical protein STCU_01508 [Strigomonas culicis]|eukprot:EPY34593.1 hypothetical protein STCU_01508 [Strigomonas culicis]